MTKTRATCWRFMLLASLVLAAMGGLLDRGVVVAAPLNEYTISDYACGGQTSGQTDAAGNLYLVCGGDVHNGGNTIRILGAGGGTKKTQAVPAGKLLTDVAPSPDGTYLYFAETKHLEPNTPDNGPRYIGRLKKNQSGNYDLEAGWKLMWTFTPGVAAEQVEGRYLATDDSGNLYVAFGNFTKGYNEKTKRINHVLKYTVNANGVASAEPVAKFRAPHNVFTSDPIDYSPVLSGIAVSGDGTTLYITEQANGDNWVSKYSVANNGFTFQTTWGTTKQEAVDMQGCNPDLEGTRLLMFPYDVAVDAKGDVYVANTSCSTVEKYTNSGVSLGGINVRPDGCGLGDICGKLHGLAVADNGDVYVPQTNRVAKAPTGPDPPVDTTAPNVTVTEPESGARLTGSVAVRARATDTGGMDRVEFRFCKGSTCAGTPASPIGIDRNTADNIFEVAWDPSQLRGDYVVKAVAFDKAGNFKHSDLVPITVGPVDKATLRVETIDAASGAPVPQGCYHLFAGAEKVGDLCDMQVDREADGVVTFIELDAGTYRLHQSQAEGGYVAAADRDVTLAAGQSKTVQVKNSKEPVVVDTTAPTVTITNPRARMELIRGERIWVKASASDEAGGSGVAQVEIKVCRGWRCSWATGTTITIDESAPYRRRWIARRTGRYTFIARATDKAGNVSGMKSVRVSVVAAPSSSAPASAEDGASDPAPSSSAPAAAEDGARDPAREREDKRDEAAGAGRQAVDRTTPDETAKQKGKTERDASTEKEVNGSAPTGDADSSADAQHERRRRER